MKQYKHKKLGWIAEQQQYIPSVYQILNRDTIIVEELLENSQDWEEIKEEDVFEKIYKSYINNDFLDDKENMVSAIKQYLGITEQEIKDNLSDWAYLESMKKLREKRGLLID